LHSSLTLSLAAEVAAEPVAEEPVPETTEEAPEEAEEAAADAAVAVEASKPGEDQFYAPPPDHVTGEVDDLAKLTNLNQNTLLSEIKVSYCGTQASSSCSCAHAKVWGFNRLAMTLAPSTRLCRTS
jgi:hypothetical protein